MKITSPTPVLSSAELGQLGPIRMLYVPAGDERTLDLTTVPIEDWISRVKESQSGVDDLAFLQRELDARGLGLEALTVILDDGRMTEAARVWFILQYVGLPATVLNGGLAALSVVPQRSPRLSAPLRLHPGAGKVGLKDRKGLKGDLPDVQILDARPAAEFRGEDLKGNSRGGHLPGAAHVSHDELLDGSHLRPAVEIAKLLDAEGVDGSKPIVSHCHGGGRAALAALAAVVAGRDNVHVYYLSFADWAADESCPVRRPDWLCRNGVSSRADQTVDPSDCGPAILCCRGGTPAQRDALTSNPSPGQLAIQRLPRDAQLAIHVLPAALLRQALSFSQPVA